MEVEDSVNRLQVQNEATRLNCSGVAGLCFRTLGLATECVWAVLEDGTFKFRCVEMMRANCDVSGSIFVSGESKNGRGRRLPICAEENFRRGQKSGAGLWLAVGSELLVAKLSFGAEGNKSLAERGCRVAQKESPAAA